MGQIVTPESFRETFEEKLGDKFDKVLELFELYGEGLSVDFTNMFLHAADQDKVDEVLAILQAHYDDHLNFQHPDIRGSVSDSLGVNRTHGMFQSLCTETLGLQAST